MSQTPPPNGERTVADAVNELIASVERLRSRFEATATKATTELQRSDRVLVHLQRAAQAADPKADQSRPRQFATCQVCGSKKGSPRDPQGRCRKCREGAS